MRSVPAVAAVILAIVCSCGGSGGRTEPRGGAVENVAGPAAPGAPADARARADDTPAAPDCDITCCSAETLALQREAAARLGDPSLEHECCLCE